MFALDPAFASGSRHLTALPLCDARLHLDARFPWLLLIPRVTGVAELEDLGGDDRARLVNEILLAGHAVRSIGEALGRPVAKLNIGLIGNITPQLHAHVVGRRPDDHAWPGPVWGHGGPEPYAGWTLDAACRAALAVLAGSIVSSVAERRDGSELRALGDLISRHSRLGTSPCSARTSLSSPSWRLSPWA